MTDEDRWYLLFLRRAEIQIAEVFDRFREQGLDPVMIKGWAAGRLYPPGRPRFFTDMDLAFSAEDFDIAARLITEDFASEFPIDLHRELRGLDTVSWRSLLHNSREVEMGPTTIRILSEEDHLRVLCVHWLMDGGEYRERLWDIYYAVSNRSGDFDWEKCLNVVDSKRRKWIVTVIGLAHRYLDLDVSGLPIEHEVLELPQWLKKTVEKEWARQRRLRPLRSCLNDPWEMIAQLRKRIPPNPIQATVNLNADFDERSRFPLQMADMSQRALSSAREVYRATRSGTMKLGRKR